jgi:hypothetical protein
MPSPKGGNRKTYPYWRVKHGKRAVDIKFNSKNEAAIFVRENQGNYEAYPNGLKLVPPNC